MRESAPRDEAQEQADRPAESRRRGTAAGAVRPGAPAARRGGLRIYKPGQGTYVRWGSAAGAAAVLFGLADFVYDQLAWFSDWVRFLVPVVLLVVLGYVVFWLIGQHRDTVDFMIHTEGEMKKVNWSTRREVLGATKVVIVTVLALGAILFVVDGLFMFFFEAIGVLRIGMIARLLGTPAE